MYSIKPIPTRELGTRLTTPLFILLCFVLRASAQSYSYEIESQPQGIISSTSGYVAPGTPVATLVAPYGQLSGYYFIGWTINGVPQTGATGAALTATTLPMTNDEVAVAVFIPAGDTTGSGLQDWYQDFWFGNTNQTLCSNPTGGAFTLFDDQERDYSPVIANVALNGGAIIRLSGATTFNGGPPQFYYQIYSQPRGIISSSSGYVAPGTPVSTPDVPYGQSSGYYFVGWTINGVPQIGVTGAALTTTTMPMTNDEVAVAVFIPAGDSTGSGLQDWYQDFWFGNTNQTLCSNPTDGDFDLFDIQDRDYSPVIANVTVNGGAIIRLSNAAFFNPNAVALPCCDTVTISISNGLIVIAWTAGGMLQSAPNPDGPYTDVTSVPDPYTIMPTGSQMFFRVRFP